MLLFIILIELDGRAADLSGPFKRVKICVDISVVYICEAPNQPETFLVKHFFADPLALLRTALQIPLSLTD